MRRPILLWAVVGLLAAPGLDAAATAIESRTLTRFDDPVIVRTGQLAGLFPSADTAPLRLYRIEHGRLVAIPFQFDSLDADGYPDSTADEFSFDADDELAFMARDTGDRADIAALRGSADAGAEIEVADPVSGARGWVYLLHYPGTPPPRAAKRYVAFDPVAHQARSDYYELSYAPARNFLTGLRILPAAAGNGENLIRRTSMRGEPRFGLLFGSFGFEFTERNSIVHIESIKTGAVRSVRRVRLSVDLGTLFPDLPSGTVCTYHYFSSFITPAQFSVPWLVLKALDSFAFEDVYDFRQEALPLTYWDGANPHGLALSGQDGARLDTKRDHEWWVTSGPAGTAVQAFRVPQEWLSWGIARGAILHRGRAERGSAHSRYAAGFSLLDMTHLRHAGVYQMQEATVVLPHPYHPGDEKPVLQMLDQPLQVTVRPLTTAGGP